ncbi:FeoB-associated Cys-rich membrane protein [Flavobacterium silvaticum]|uniref:FeoB-associated Cys-rich membrane protein n=1 Tax=Flavobacterium silvaticum TaxID=1852020 RepID=A0A972FUG7_9FLAO|nr:FeoB-associated Cys-rich membrane protein [Flavobacterium silvaticum]NMH28252.1 FeoB-associated Cys-rich membrane protein [Flavobacterium silvaticum]
MQTIIAIGLLVVAVVFLARKFVFKPKKKDGCGPDCGCN